jgi:murein DD-endopeptidase MepM/ murein hydrolase activator NlpD
MTVRGAWCVVFSALGAGSVAAQQVPPLPDSTGWGVHVLALARAPDSSIWVGTYGEGIFVLRPGATAWERIANSSDTATHSISWDFVHAFAFGPKGEIWYGTVGNGWGLSRDGGKTWKNWEYRQLGPEWQYVAPNGIVTRGDTTYIATADGIKVSWDDGVTWRVITDSAGAATAKDSLLGMISSQYLLGIRVSPEALWAGHLRGRQRSVDGGRSWRAFVDYEPCESECSGWRRRSLETDTAVPSLAEDRPGLQRALAADPRAARAPRTNAPTQARHTWFRRPISLADQPYIDQTYRFGSTMGGNFQAHQGVEFNNPDGTPVHAIGDGVVVYSGPAEAGANTIAIRHDRPLMADGRRLYLFSAYYHNTRLLKQVGNRVKAGDVIALVGNTGRATNDHLHLEVHAAPTTDSSKIVHPDVRYPPFNANPELWIEPLPGTGLVAGQVWDSKGQPVQQVRIYGLVKAEPQETPFSYIETYGSRNHSDPVYHEHFAIGDVPPGAYTLGVEIEGKKVFRRIRVAAGKLTWVEFRPDAH